MCRAEDRREQNSTIFHSAATLVLLRYNAYFDKRFFKLFQAVCTKLHLCCVSEKGLESYYASNTISGTGAIIKIQ